ncbi:MAG: hypothetical protein LUD02_08345 [Tannerellaceae bacterium]|nr:hypothetical protein [Tannerellaceae bacterium]MCD8264156.1 hypothetical protein [Tannerellaceae bacterium]
MKKILFALLTLLTFTFISCSDDDWRKGSTNENGFKLSYTIVSPESVLTKASTDIVKGEDLVNSFYILFLIIQQVVPALL